MRGAPPFTVSASILALVAIAIKPAHKVQRGVTSALTRGEFSPNDSLPTISRHGSLSFTHGSHVPTSYSAVAPETPPDLRSSKAVDRPSRRSVAQTEHPLESSSPDRARNGTLNRKSSVHFWPSGDSTPSGCCRSSSSEPTPPAGAADGLAKRMNTRDGKEH